MSTPDIDGNTDTVFAEDLCSAQYPGVWVGFFSLTLLFRFLALMTHTVLLLGEAGPSILLF